MRRSLLLTALACASACAARPAPTSAPSEVPVLGRGDGRTTAAQRLADLRVRERSAAAATSAPGASKDDPLPTCGTTGSYVAVADFECEGGVRPLDGDIQQGLRSRRGNLGPNAAGHIIDLYEVPCPEGPKKVHVDMYGCEQARPSRSEVEVQHFVEVVFLAGEHDRFAERCRAEEARGPDRVSLMLQSCSAVMPTALREQHRAFESTAWISRHCAATPSPTETEPRRYQYLRNVFAALDALREHQRRSPAERESERRTLAPEYARACDVDLKAFEAWRRQSGGD